MRLVALLRGINLAGRNRLAMAALRDVVEGLGYVDVATLLQSGNVVATAPPATKPDAAATARALENAIAKRFGFEVDVIVRTAAELAKVVAANPLRSVVKDDAKYVVLFLAKPPARGALAALGLSEREVAARGREIYLWCPDGVSESKALKQLTERRLGTRGTFRNWKTVTKLLAMSRAADHSEKSFVR